MPPDADGRKQAGAVQPPPIQTATAAPCTCHARQRRPATVRTIPERLVHARMEPTIRGDRCPARSECREIGLPVRRYPPPPDKAATDKANTGEPARPGVEQQNGTLPDSKKRPYNHACFPCVFFHTIPTERETDAILCKIGLSNFDATCSPDSEKNRSKIGLTFWNGRF